MFRGLKTLIVPALAAVIAASASNAAIWQWSKTAATNATADPSINWSEGMSPSTVNDSARAMMARVAEWRDDLSGVLLTTGSGTVYLLSTNEGFDPTPTIGQAVAFTMHATNGIAPTLRVDGGNTYPIQSAAGVAVGAGVLVAQAPYTAKFSGTAWVMHGFYGAPISIPIGAVIDYTGSSSPNSNFVLPFGQCISRTTYSFYFGLVGTRYGVCDGVTTFAVPDMRGTILAGLDTMGGSTRGLITGAGSSCDGTQMGSQCGAQNKVLVQLNLPNVNLSVSATAISTSTSLSASTSSITGTPYWNVATNDIFQLQSGPSFNFRPAESFLAVTPAITTTTTTTTLTDTTVNGTAATGGADVPVTILPPLQIVTKLLRIL